MGVCLQAALTCPAIKSFSLPCWRTQTPLMARPLHCCNARTQILSPRDRLYRRSTPQRKATRWGSRARCLKQSDSTSEGASTDLGVIWARLLRVRLPAIPSQ